MKHIVAITITAFGLLALPPTFAQTASPKVAAETTRLLNEANVSGISMSKIEAGKLLWTNTSGMRSPAQPVTNDTVFNAASLTKPVFAVLVMHLVAQDKLALDEPLSAYWIDPDIAEDPNLAKLTARTVLSHQSGLPNWRGKQPLRFMFTPGKRHEYSGEGYEYLRRAIEQKLSTRIDQLTQQYVFEPAGMTSSAMGWRDTLGKNVAFGFDEARTQIDTSIFDRTPNAAANLMTTSEDYARFLSWVAAGADLPDNLFKQMVTPQSMHENPAERFGLGWKLVPLGGYDALMHDGREPGVRNFAVIDYQSNEGIVILTNSSNGDLLHRALSTDALSFGQTLWHSTDALVWHYLQSLPGQALTPMSKGIARSPAYLSTFLNAANTTLLQPAEVSQKVKQQASDAILPTALRLLKGEVAPSDTEKLLTALFRAESEQMALAKQLSTDEARDWAEQLTQ